MRSALGARPRIIYGLACAVALGALACRGSLSEDEGEPDPGVEGTGGATGGAGGAPRPRTGGTGGSGGSGAIVPPPSGTDGGATTSPRADAAAGSGGAGGARTTPAPDAGARDAAGMCAPTGGGPHWVEEGGMVSATIRCATGRMLAGDAFELMGLPRGATYDPATARLSWRPGLDQAGVYLVPIVAKPFAETGELKIGVADKFDDPANAPIRDPKTYTEEFGLPVFHLTTGPEYERNLEVIRREKNAIWADSCKPVCIPEVYAPTTVVYRGHTYMAEGRYRGSSSLGYPKKNYTLRFAKEDKFNEPFLAGGRMAKRRRIALITTFDDNSYARWRLAFETWNRMDPSIIRIEHFSAVVYVNGRYVGLYTVSDKIDDNMMQRHGLTETGNLYMGVTHNANFDVWARQESEPNRGMIRPRNCPFEGFTKKEGLPDQCNGTTFVPSAFDELLPFLDFVAKSDDVKFRAEVAKVIAVNDYIAWYVHATAIIASDSYAKNALHYRDPVAGGPWRVVIWDYNASLGQAWNTVRTSATSEPRGIPTSTAMFSTNNLWRRLWAHPTIGPQMRAKYASVLKNELKLEDVLAYFDGLVKEIDASARRDERKWSAMYRSYYGPTSTTKRMDFTTYAEEITYLRGWLQARWRHLQTIFP